MPTIDQLNKRRPDCDLEELRDLKALYDGGKSLRNRLHKFLPQRQAEADEVYAIRKGEAHYRNYLGTCIDYFTALLFTGEPQALSTDAAGKAVELEPFYVDFSDDVDGHGQDLKAFFKDRLTDAMVHRVSWFMVEHAKWDGSEPESKLAFDSSGLGRATLCKLDTESVLDWDFDDGGELEYVLVHSVKTRRASLAEGYDRITETWEHILPDKVDVYEITYTAQDKASGKVAGDTNVALKESLPHRFGCVPVLRVELPVGLWVASRLETPQLTHFRLSNALTWGMGRTCFAMPVFKLNADEEGQFRMPTMGAGHGIIIGADEDVTWISPPGVPFVALSDEIKAQKDEIFRLAMQMAMGVENNAAAVGRSAESKASDSEATRVILQAFAAVVLESIERVYDLIGRLRGDKHTWSIEGLGSFESADVGGLADLLTKVDTSGGIPSVTFNTRVKTRIAEAILPDMDQDTKQQVASEIEEALNKAHEHAELMTEAELIGDDDTEPTAPKPAGPAKKASPKAALGRNKKAT